MKRKQEEKERERWAEHVRERSIKKKHILWFKAAVLNLGTRTPGGYAINSQGVRKQLVVTLKNTQYLVILVFNLIRIKKFAIFGYNKLVRK